MAANRLEDSLSDGYSVTRSYIDKRRNNIAELKKCLEWYIGTSAADRLEDPSMSIAYSKIFLVADVVSDALDEAACFASAKPSESSTCIRRWKTIPLPVHAVGHKRIYDNTSAIERLEERQQLPNGFRTNVTGYHLEMYVVEPHYKARLIGRPIEKDSTCIGKISINFNSDGDESHTIPPKIEIYGEKNVDKMNHIADSVLGRLDKREIRGFKRDVTSKYSIPVSAD